jgi:hypothetical protein
LIAIVASFPAAALTALVFRFPIPFAGYVSGPDGVLLSLYAVAFYGMLGGFVVQGVLGGVSILACGGEKSAWTRNVAAAAVAAMPGVLVLSVLDWIIGPW